MAELISCGCTAVYIMPVCRMLGDAQLQRNALTGEPQAHLRADMGGASSTGRKEEKEEAGLK